MDKIYFIVYNIKKILFFSRKALVKTFQIKYKNESNNYIKYHPVIGLDFQKYRTYGTEDFISDEHFTRWVHKPEDSMLSNFWESLIRVYPEKMEEIIHARNQILQFPHNYQPLTPTEIDRLWNQINITITTN